MVLDKLEELGYKPKRGAKKEDEQKEIADILKNIQSSEVKQQILDLLLEALSEPDPREILIYGMYVKNCFSPIIRAKDKDHIEKTMKLLIEALGKV
jgi:DNA-binding Lrp family transcriptional regulator